MFKSKEDLIKENNYVGGKNYDYHDNFDTHSFDNGFKCGVNRTFSSIAERVKFYERYLNESWRFGEEEPELYDEWMKSKENDLMIWLFDFCFDGVK